MQPADNPPKPLPWWALHRRAYAWMLSFADTRWAVPALFLFSCAESIIFPVPSFVLQIPMTLRHRERAWWHATVNTAGSVVGGFVGYIVGVSAVEFAKKFLGFDERILERAKDAIDQHSLASEIGYSILGAIVIHPYKFFTIACGMLHVSLLSFFLASFIGRGIFFYAIAALLHRFGEPVRHFIERWFNWLCLALGVVIVAIVLAPKLLSV